MYLSKVTTTKQLSDSKLFLQIKKDDILLEGVDPALALFQRLHVEVDGAALAHQDEAEHVLRLSIFEVVLLDPAVLDAQETCIPQLILLLLEL